MLAWLLVASATVRIRMDHKSHGHATPFQVDLTREFFFKPPPGYRLATGYGGLAGFGYEFGYQALPGPFVWLRRPPAGVGQPLCNGVHAAPVTVNTP
jgi:hypothetical protein